MKPQLLKISNPADYSFNLFNQDCPYFPTPWHYHPEYEIVLILEGDGKKFIGSSITDFQPGDLCMIGSYLPHYYKNSPEHYQGNPQLRAKSIVIHFLEEFMGDKFWELPEAQSIKLILERSKRGLQFGEETLAKVAPKMKSLVNLQGMSRLTEMLSILTIFSEAKDITFLTSNPISLRNEVDSARMNKVMEFVMQRYQEEITLEQVADLASMSESAFSRYFKKRTRRTFSQFLSEIRIEHACKLLMEDKMSVAEISFESGFNNLSNFNRQFKNLKKTTPLAFRMKFLK
ncbi:MAG: AraC family transcriptional regulator [Spirosomaceae bacterium]|jgi:AraC-like DNA-binding protein|nr:AraC family transcriptional regulator [Spirosomataceae bacterium]